MGYYTRFNLEAKYAIGKKLYEVKPEVWDKIEQAAEEFQDSYGGGTIHSVLLDQADSMKWYDWREDMQAFSELFPKVVFVLNGEGEESGDVWRCYIRNGKMQHVQAKIVFDDFDPDMLE